MNVDSDFEPADIHVAQRLTALAEETSPEVTLAVRLAVRALRGGSVCVDLRAAAADFGLTADDWLTAVAASPLAGTPPVLRLLGDLLYLDRYWLEEEQVCADVLALVDAQPAGELPDVVRLFPDEWAEQRAAAQMALTQGLTVLTGGPGTGKTTTVARLLALLAEQAALAGRPTPRIALAAPTGKAAARLQEAVQEQVDRLGPTDRGRLTGLQATTLHRLLGSRPDTSSRFRHHRGNRLPHDVIVVDETSMVSLTMMARLLEAVRPDTRLLLVGDPDQLASVEAGAVLADLVDGLGADRVAALTTSHRFGAAIGTLAAAVRSGDADAALQVLAAGGAHIEWLPSAAGLRDVLLPQALRLREACVLGATAEALSTLDEHRLLCAHRHGPYGVTHWNRQVQRWLTEATGDPLWATWYAGRPILVTANDYGLKLYNGDTGVAVASPDGLRVAVGAQMFAPGRLAEVETMHAMTIHKSQGSQADEVTVLLPTEDSRLLTRELFYTAVTRAQTRVRVVGSEAEVRAAISRQAIRATGLGRRLRS
ncbi:exodeoxyribonuclease V subunit alpha [Mycolicibacterium bacteremicum]|uniref:RecBCD enzyme subunit RecD n=1 Tax=Mycolicibacterium bacteremicum TaxID=564198 RepID=A0A1W9Z362_MYCBA|nr:exodeoxyribonuclease V subunit alpha [Mycolicibacterium bacteremicum]MCV7431922.1 exodeoxyribonuclease V subunit alpha [Mycolicibacterium bacteremicum]ORA06629.1 exodeoxyribonuclease V subunit alpha [Mycolicibacterium bacteremicum]